MAPTKMQMNSHCALTIALRMKNAILWIYTATLCRFDNGKGRACTHTQSGKHSGIDLTEKRKPAAAAASCDECVCVRRVTRMRAKNLK